MTFEQSFRSMVVGAAMVLGALAVPVGAADRLDSLEQAARARPTDSQATADLGSAYRSAEAVERGVKFFAAFHAQHPPNSMSLVWQGSLKALASSKGEDMEARLEMLQSGIADMDRAVQSFPEDPKVRVVRGVTISYFPTFLGMSGKAIRDLEQALHGPSPLGPGVEKVARDGLARAYRQAGRSADADALAQGPSK